MHQEPPSIVGENPDREIGLRQISAEPSSTPAKGPPQACLFVGSISPETTEAQLISHFSQFGTVLKVKLLKDKVNSKPYAFVQYSALEEADRCLAHDNHILNTRKLRIEPAKVNRTLFLAKFSSTFSNSDLRKIAEGYGQVETVTIIKNNASQKSKGCGFVKYMYREDAINALSGFKTRYRKWVVEWATSANDPELLGVDMTSIFVGGLNPNLISEQKLTDYFTKYGLVESVTLVHSPQPDALQDDSTSAEQEPLPSSSAHTSLPEANSTQDSHPPEVTPRRSAYAFVKFQSPQSAASAIESENGANWLESNIRVQYCQSPIMKYRKTLSKFKTYGYSNGESQNSSYFVPAANVISMPMAETSQYTPSWGNLWLNPSPGLGPIAPPGYFGIPPPNGPVHTTGPYTSVPMQHNIPKNN